MAHDPSEEIRKSVATVIEQGTLLRIRSEAQRIAGICGLPVDQTAEQLFRAAIDARVNLEMGAPLKLKRPADQRKCECADPVAAGASFLTGTLGIERPKTRKVHSAEGPLSAKDISR